MIKQQNYRLWHKLNGLARYFLVHLCTDLFPFYVVNEYPKSGGSWVGEMLSSALNVPFPRNRLPMLRSSILHGHIMQSWNVHNVLIVWRDGRDVLISQYFHSLFKNEVGNQLLVDNYRADLDYADYDDIQKNLPSFMKYVFEKKRHPKMSWADFVNKWVNARKCVHVKYEDLRVRPVEELIRIVKQLSGKDISVDMANQIVHKHSFENVSGRNVGKEKRGSFMRKGIVGDWKNHFSDESKILFDKYAGKELIRLGYEFDNSWARC